MRGLAGACRLIPGECVEQPSQSHYIASGTEPWLEVEGLDVSRLAGRFIEVTYRASLFDDPARPVFRFITSDGNASDRIGVAPIAGAGIWAGRVPTGTRRLAISPTNRPGAFTFRLDRIRTRTWLGLLLSGVRRRPRQARSALLTRCIGWAPESDNNLAWAIGAMDFDAYADWLARRARPVEPAGLDAPSFDWSAAPPIRLVAVASGGQDALARTVASLTAQSFPRWELWITGSPADPRPDDPRIVTMTLDAALERLQARESGVLVGAIQAGDTLPPYALAFLAEQLHRNPSVAVFYGDEVAAGFPILKPGWSQWVANARGLLGRAVFASNLDTWSAEERRWFVVDGELPLVAAQADATTVKPLRRVLMERPQDYHPHPVRASTPIDPAAPKPRAAIVILTRNQPALLSRVVASIRTKSPPDRYRILIVDNGDPNGPATQLLTGLERDPDILLLRRPERFNFSGFCNEAAAASDEPLLIFLNDDTEVLSEGWLDRLAAVAFEDQVGAVGAKLTYPDGRIQHIGVLVGMGGSAGHLGSMVSADDPGWLGRNTVVHEVSAVTGACLAVAREKFLAVGGFDAEHLPIELSDIDLCLKLNARGWQTVVDPLVHLMHEESASRGGATFRRLDKYSQQREIFIHRWRHVLRDDPAFHPGLSLYSLNAALG